MFLSSQRGEPLSDQGTERRERPGIGRTVLQWGAVAVVVMALGACKSAVKLDDGAPIESRNAMLGAGQVDAGNAAGRAGAAGQGGVDGRGLNGAAGGAAGSSAGAGAAGGAARDPLQDPNSPLAKRSIYFDYDSYVVRDEYRATIDAHARFLTSDRSRRVIIQGNTDDRGSREYNLALGQKRAEAVRRSLTALGVPETQVEAISLGKEKPKSTGQDEASFAENRRADLVYP
jgi:peptidoglycan-associated lipoprotein